MACASCQQARNNVVQNISSGNVGGTVKAITAGAYMMAEKLAGVDINKKYGVSPTSHSISVGGKPYTRD
jgi:hypothetical protein